jgi:hypothetical protein
VATQKDQLGEFLKALKVTEFDAGIAAIEQFQASALAAQEWQTSLSGIYSALGATDPAGARDAITTLRSTTEEANGNVGAIFAALSTAEHPVTDQAGAIAQVSNWKRQLAESSAEVSRLTTAQTDFDGKVAAEVITRCAAAGIPAPVKKDPAAGNEGANTMTRAALNSLPLGARADFFRQGGKLVDQAA